MDKEEYEEYLTHIRAYLESEEAKVFTIDHFITTMMTLIKTPPSEPSSKKLTPSRLFLPMEEFQAKIVPIPLNPEYPFFATNPSIKKTETGYDINYRLVNYDHKNGMDYWPIGGRIFINKNILVSTDKEFTPLIKREIVDNAVYERFPYYPVIGQEDYHLFDFKGDDWFTCSISDGNFLNTTQMALGKISKDHTCCDKLTPLVSPNPLRKEKNWLPFAFQNEIFAIYKYEPLTIYKLDPNTGSHTIAYQTDSKFDCSNFSGSAGPIPFDDGYLVLIHELNITDRRNYLHRFLFLNKEFQITKISPLFYFTAPGIEFACGMTWSHNENEIIVSFGKEDKEAYLAIFPKESIEKHLSIK